MHSICIFCGSNPGKGPDYVTAARALVRAVVASGARIVFGGGRVGLMGVVAEEALAAGAHVTGVTPRNLLQHEVILEGLTELHVADSMHERKVMMTRLSDAFVVLPGGLGTFDELFEALTLLQLGVHHKPVGVLNVAGFYDGLLAFLDRVVAEGFLRSEHRDMIVVDEDPVRLLDRLRTWQPPAVGKHAAQRHGSA